MGLTAPRFADVKAVALGVSAQAGPSCWRTGAMKAVRDTAVALAGAPALVGGQGEGGRSPWQPGLVLAFHFGQGK